MHTTISITAFTLTVAFSFSPRLSEGAPEHGHTPEGHATHTDTGTLHSHETPRAQMSAEELFEVTCEHNIPQHTCAECRYELGMVKLTDDLIRPAGGDTGLFEVIETKLQDAADALTILGEIQLNARRTTRISPRIAGIVRTVSVETGSVVKEGDVLFEIESLELGRAIGDYRKSAALAALSKINLDREERLFTQNASPEVDVIEARMQYQQHHADQQAAGQALTIMGLDPASLDKAPAENPGMGNAWLAHKAPTRGRIVAGQLRPGETVTVGQEVFQLADVTSLWVEMDIYEQNLAAVLEQFTTGGVEVILTTDAFPGEEFPGRMELIASIMDPQTRTVKARALVKNQDERLRPGMFCRVRIMLNQGRQALIIPPDALLADEGQHFVFRQIRDDYYIRHPVTVGRRLNSGFEICGGLTVGDRIVGRGAFLLKSDILREKMGAGCAD